MITFNSSHIIVGQIKEILTSFNLPKYRIYTKENEEYLQKYGLDIFGREKDIIPTIKKNTKDNTNINYIPYIKNNLIQYYVATPIKDEPGKFKYAWEPTVKPYIYNNADLNSITNLNIKNNIYDYQTHEYLGDYLRFKRDYENIDLMSLYNCFSNRICNELDYSWDLRIPNSNESKTNKIVFNTKDINYKIYMLPVKLFKQYTIAIDCSSPVEVCCGIYNKYQDTRDKLKNIPQLTYKRFNSMLFGQPNLYEKLTELQDLISPNYLADLGLNEQDLKLFIKLPTNNNSSIVVLEGDYRRYNDSILAMNDKKLIRTQNYTVTNFDITVNDFSHFKPVSALQLLRINTQTQFPFADRLIEYLSNNVVDSSDEIIDNIKRAQKVIELNINNLDYDMLVWNQNDKKFTWGKSHLRQELRPKQYGLWDNSIRAIVYDKFNNTVKANNNDINHDILGYIDKDIEKWYWANTGTENKPNYISISNIDLYTDKNGLYTEEDN